MKNLTKKEKIALIIIGILVFVYLIFMIIRGIAEYRYYINM